MLRAHSSSKSVFFSPGRKAECVTNLLRDAIHIQFDESGSKMHEMRSNRYQNTNQLFKKHLICISQKFCRRFS